MQIKFVGPRSFGQFSAQKWPSIVNKESLKMAYLQVCAFLELI